MKAKHFLPAILLVISYSACQKDNDQNKSFDINGETSKVEWKGSAPTHFHTGSFDVEGTFTTDKKGKVNGGEFTIPIASITNYDLPDGPKQDLLTHLKSDDFFDVAIHPHALFKISTVAPYTGSDASAIEGANFVVNGNFTMLGETHPLSFPARITTRQDSVLTAATFKLNRLTWGMDSYNDPNAGLYLLPDVDITLDLRAGRDD